MERGRGLTTRTGSVRCDTGRAQAELVAHSLRGAHFARAYASPASPRSRHRRARAREVEPGARGGSAATKRLRQMDAGPFEGLRFRPSARTSGRRISAPTCARPTPSRSSNRAPSTASGAGGRRRRCEGPRGYQLRRGVVSLLIREGIRSSTSRTSRSYAGDMPAPLRAVIPGRRRCGYLRRSRFKRRARRWLVAGAGRGPDGNPRSTHAKLSILHDAFMRNAEELARAHEVMDAFTAARGEPFISPATARRSHRAGRASWAGWRPPSRASRRRCGEGRWARRRRRWGRTGGCRGSRSRGRSAASLSRTGSLSSANASSMPSASSSSLSARRISPAVASMSVIGSAATTIQLASPGRASTRTRSRK